MLGVSVPPRCKTLRAERRRDRKGLSLVEALVRLFHLVHVKITSPRPLQRITGIWGEKNIEHPSGSALCLLGLLKASYWI